MGYVSALARRFAAPSPGACHVPHLLLDTGALKTTEEKAEVPSLDMEGWLRPLRKWREASLAGTDGVVGSSRRLSEVERTTPFLMFRPTGLTLRAAPSKERDHLLDGAATPPLPRRGLCLSFRLSQTPVSSGRLVGNEQPLQGGEGISVLIVPLFTPYQRSCAASRRRGRVVVERRGCVRRLRAAP